VNPLSINRTLIEGFESIQINTGLMELSIIPELGGKINSLRDHRNGREWLWRHPRYPYKRVPHGSVYVEQADTGGWDECFPSVAECTYPSEPWQGALIQDHGEIWSHPAGFDLDQQAGIVKLTTRSQGIVLPYTFTRVLTLAENSASVHVEYEVVNNSDQPIHYVWSMHPLLAIEPGMELLLPASATFNVNGTFPENLVSTTKNLKYPFAASGLNFPILPETSAARAIKFWSDPLPAGEGWTSVRAKDGELKMHWDVAYLPQVAVWMNLGALGMDGGAPYYNMGLEPCMGGQDSLNDAVNTFNLYETLKPHGTKHWWLDIELIA
jgi:galactose mutarotase-like enzyme